MGISQRPSVVPELVVGEFGQLAGAEHRFVTHQQRRRAFGVAILAGLLVEHELPQRPLQPRHLPAQESEPRARNQRAGLEIQPQRRAEIGVFLRREIETARGSPAGDFDIARLVRAFGHIGIGKVGMGGQRIVHLPGKLALFLLQRGQRGLEFGHFSLEPLGLVLVAPAHRCTDQLGGLIAPVLRLLHPRGDRAPRGIQCDDRLGYRLHPPPRQGGIESLRVVADQADIMHGAAYWPRPARSSARARPALNNRSRYRPWPLPD